MLLFRLIKENAIIHTSISYKQANTTQFTAKALYEY